MVGRNPFGSKDHSFNPRETPPPPSYKESNPSPVILAETTVTTTEVVTTTTQTTTHFFSLPLWRRRAPASSSSSHIVASKSATHKKADEMGRFGVSRFMVEKDLPPTPPNESDQGSRDSRWNSQRNSVDEIMEESMLPSLFPRPDSMRPSSSKESSSPSRPSTAVALAQASLGIGLPHILPHVSPSCPSPDINTVAFTSSVDSSSDSPFPSGDRPPSKTRAFSSAERPTLDEPKGQRRARGLSLGPAALLQFGSPDSKGKGKEKEANPVTDTPVKSLTRRASFWSRKKTTSPEKTIPLQQSETNLVPLPYLPPVSPLDMDLHTGASGSSDQPGSTRGLSRSRSERASSTVSSQRIPDLGKHIPKRASRRPATADPSERPNHPVKLILSGSREYLTSSPPSSPAAEHGALLPDGEPDLSRRPRAHTNPPLLHRLSMNLFSSSPSQSPSSSSPAIPNTSSSRAAGDIPKPQIDEESPEGYLSRLTDSVSKAEIAGILASNNDDFHVQALRAYIGRFDFADDPLDVALRRLLMDVGLPRETQQIDRVMEAFASRYYQSHPSLFTSQDQPYILAFSLIMLHTDAFNKSNKRKMTKPDYIKNTRLPGVAPEVLDCFYDNIVFAPFIFIEDPVDVNGQRGYIPDGSRVITSLNSSVSSSGGGSGTTLLGKGNKVDPYYLITNNLLDPLRVPVETFVPLVSPYTYEGTGGHWNEEELQHSFSKADVIEIGTLDHSKIPPASPLFNASMGHAAPFSNSMGAFPDLPVPSSETWKLRVTKASLLNRKDDLLEGHRKPMNRKWRTWAVILTGSQLLFFRDPSWISTLLKQSEPSENHVLFRSTAVFKPDEVLSVKDAIAVYDRSYMKHANVFRFVMPDGRNFLLGSSNETEMNEWIARINYASAFKSTGVRMRPLGMSGKDVQLTGVAAATSHLHDLQHFNQARAKNWDSDTSRDLMGMLTGDFDTLPRKTPPRRKVTIMSDDTDLDVPMAPEIDGADQFKATFDQVKADLAAGRCASPENGSPTRDTWSPVSNEADTRLPSRTRVVLSKIRELESKLSASQTQLESDMRFVCNIATLTPFQRSTRERLSLAVQGVSKRVMNVRLDIERMMCHRDVLSNDLAAEARDWGRAKKIALRAATETLLNHHDISVPRMTLSFHESESPASPPIPIPSKSYTPSSHRPESTTGSVQSFHSALDFGPEWPSPDDPAASNFLEASHFLESPRNSSYDLRGVDSPKEVGARVEVASPRTSSDDMRHEKFYTAQESPEEQAEEWNKTRCAQRVSLVRVPSTIALSARMFERSVSQAESS